ncbi:MAG: efflux RND transporter permease subunit, partial [Janthinobacterium lividum]
ADAASVAQTVALPLERAVNGVDHLLFLQSNVSDGSLSLTASFDIGTDPDQATINVSNRVQTVTSTLPAETQRAGVQVSKASSTLLGIVSLGSPGGRYDDLFLGAYAQRQVIDELKRVPGVGQAEFFGQKDYAMRVWLHPDKLAQFRLGAADVADAIRAQNGQFATGTVNAPPDRGGAWTTGMTAPGRLPDAAAFGAIVLAAGRDGTALRLRDVARVQLGSEHYDFDAVQGGGPAMPIGVFLQPGANALSVMAALRARMAVLARDFPPGVSWSVPLDTTQFVRASIRETLLGLGEAMVLVALVVWAFLRNGRATLIPLLAVPVSVIGTFAGLAVLGYSVNLLTLFGLVLAIGIVVDDAIVVVENVSRLIDEDGLSPREATARAMGEVGGALVAIVLVLCAVFVPVTLQGGLTGQLYRQFAATVAIAVTLSGFVALTLTPALCVLLLRPAAVARAGVRRGPGVLRRVDRAAGRVASGYGAAVAWLLRRPVAGVALALLCAGLGAAAGLRLPAALVPEEDRGEVFVVWSLPPAATLSRTEALMGRVDAMMSRDPDVERSLAFSGFNQLSNGSQTNSGVAFVHLSDWSLRGAGHTAAAIAARFTAALSREKDAMIASFNPPAIEGLGNVGGFELHILDRGGLGLAALEAATRAFLHAAAARPELAGMVTTLQANTPRFRVDVDRDRAAALGVPVDAVYAALQSTFGSLYVNDFTLDGRNYHVNLQSDAAFRADPADLRQVFVRASLPAPAASVADPAPGVGEMVPLAALVHMRRTVGADQLERFNVYASAQVTGSAAPGYSSGQAIAAAEAVARDALPRGFDIAWAGAAYQQKLAGRSGGRMLLLGLLMVGLILAAQFESWRLPFAVLLSVPLALGGAFVAVWLRGRALDVYVQIGLVALVGLAAKNAVLIVQFATLEQRRGLDARAAALSAARLRLRPIVMTSLAFVIGCVPLALATGPGAGSRQSLGTCVVGGMIGATVLGTLFVPLFFHLMGRRAAKQG